MRRPSRVGGRHISTPLTVLVSHSSYSISHSAITLRNAKITTGTGIIIIMKPEVQNELYDVTYVLLSCVLCSIADMQEMRGLLNSMGDLQSSTLRDKQAKQEKNGQESKRRQRQASRGEDRSR